MRHGDHEQRAASNPAAVKVDRVPSEAQEAFLKHLGHAVLDAWPVGVDSHIRVQERGLRDRVKIM